MKHLATLSVFMLWIACGISDPQSSTLTVNPPVQIENKPYVPSKEQVVGILGTTDLLYRPPYTNTVTVTVTNYVYITNQIPTVTNRIYFKPDPFRFAYLVHCGDVLVSYEDNHKTMIINSPIRNPIKKIIIYGFEPVEIHDCTKKTK